MTGVLDGRWPLVGAEEMRALDRYTIDTLGIPGELLMESAGRAVVETVLEQLEGLRASESGGPEVAVVCGAGNNGGDGFVVARHLFQLGVSVRVALLADEFRLAGDAERNFARCRSLGVPVEGADWRPPRTGVLVDAIFGTGLTRAVEGTARESIERIAQARRSGVRVVAVDLPSGLDADTGAAHGAAVGADVTVTIALPKLGLTLEPGRERAGRIVVARIGIADALPGEEARAELWSAEGAGRALPTRPIAGHKGTFGHVLLVAGSEGKTGAAALAAVGAGRAGAGLVTLACPAGLNDILEEKCTEAMTVPVADTGRRALAASAEDSLLALAAERDLVAAGPGIGREEETRALMRGLAKRLDCPLVLDADGAIAFAGDLAILKGRDAATILTPHPGEAAQLLACSAAEINDDRVGAARELARESGAIVLLKGAATIAAEPGGSVIVNSTGGPLLASGGTGDVLLGMVAAYAAQGVDPLAAAAVAAYVHGAAADLLGTRYGASGLLAGELADQVPTIAEMLRRSARTRSWSAGGGDEGIGATEARGSRLAIPFPGAAVHPGGGAPPREGDR